MKAAFLSMTIDHALHALYLTDASGVRDGVLHVKADVAGDKPAIEFEVTPGLMQELLDRFHHSPPERITTERGPALLQITLTVLDPDGVELSVHAERPVSDVEWQALLDAELLALLD